MTDFTIRAATAEDQATIRRLIRQEQLDPTSTHWSRFLVAEVGGQIVGIGQVKEYPGCQELGSLITLREYRGLGIAAALIAALEARARRPVYLLCASKMEPYYQRFGYQTIGWKDAPTALKVKLAPTTVLRLFGVRVLVMRKD